MALAGGDGWTPDFDAARKQAADAKKDLLLDFTGSDWCGWCIRLDDEVFKHDAFKKAVADQFVLVEIDFPQDEKKIDDKTREQNEKLQARYGVEGYPTIVLADADGRPYAFTGYREGGPEAYVKHLGELRSDGERRRAGLQKAEAASGREKAELLIAAIEGLPDAAVSSFHGELIDRIKAADPKDETGFAKRLAARERAAETEKKLVEFFQKGDADGAMKYIDEIVANESLEGAFRQQIGMTKVGILANQGRAKEAVALLEPLRKLDPTSDLAKNMDEIKKEIAGRPEEKEAGHDD